MVSEGLEGIRGPLFSGIATSLLMKVLSRRSRLQINISICPVHKSWLSFCMVRGAKSHQSCLTLCDPDCSPPGPSVHGILQARILECVSMPSSRGSSPPTDWTCISLVSGIDRRVLYHQRHLGCPMLHGPALKQAKHADMDQHPRTHVNFPFYLDNHIH